MSLVFKKKVYSPVEIEEGHRCSFSQLLAFQIPFLRNSNLEYSYGHVTNSLHSHLTLSQNLTRVQDCRVL